MPQLLCLSSGRADRYRHDVLRASALPYKSQIQYRYSSDIVDPSIQTRLASNSLRGEVALLAHVDAYSAGKTGDHLFVTPVRRAVLCSSRQIGEYFILVFQLWGYAVSDDLPYFQTTLPNARPLWADGEPKGFWCAPYRHGLGWEESFGLEGFQRVARNLQHRPDFSAQSFFFAVEQISRRGSYPALEPNADGEFALKAGQHFNLRLFHFDPAGTHKASGAAQESLSIAVTSPALEAVTTASLDIDSPYDLKSFAFRTTAGHMANQAAAIVVRTIDKQTNQATTLQPELHLPVDVRMPVGRMIFISLILAALLFAQQYVAAIAKGPIAAGAVIALLVLALMTATVAVFALKRPV